ncbi:MAG: malto-oligosyltrehalose trehalohydrolase [Planctomycetes bacterium]|nr:malto-oligosyltrehalose trehalohydrolase [Planctomycetota bacterium]
MSKFQVWAPVAKRVQVELKGRRHEMAAGSDGWWNLDVADAAAGDDYSFVLDSGRPLSDPRSRWQPRGPEGPSRIVDFSQFSWRCPRFVPPPLESAIIYELHVGTFTPRGTFESAIEKLGHLVDLGVTHVELLPLGQFSGSRGWGYDGVDIYAPHHAYGGPNGLNRFVDACHEHGLAVVIDVVYNHFGPEGCYLKEFGPYFTDRYKTPWGEAVNFDGPDSGPVRKYVIDNAIMWLRDYRADALRVDGVHAIMDASAVHILQELCTAVHDLNGCLGRRLAVIGESDLNDPRVILAPELGGYGFDAQWTDDFHHAVHSLVTGERDGYYGDFGSLADLAKSFGNAFVYDGRFSKVRRRNHGRRPPEHLDGDKFVVCLQNHDQVGNRIDGTRVGHIASDRRQMIGAAMVLVSPFIPMLFEGEEWGASAVFQYFTDYQSRELAEAVRQGRRREFADFGWDPQKVPDPQADETFERSKLDWDELAQQPHAAMLEWYRRLIWLRKTMPSLCNHHRGHVRVDYDESQRWIVVNRCCVALACNLSDQRQSVPLRGGGGRIILSMDQEASISGAAILMPPDCAALVAVGECKCR